MRSSSCLSQVTDKERPLSATGKYIDDIPYPIKPESLNESVTSYLNRSYISGFFNPKKESSYGDLGIAKQICQRPNTSKAHKIAVHHKRHVSTRPSTTKSSKSSNHKRWFSNTNSLNNSNLNHAQSFGIEGYKVPLWGLLPRGDKRTKFLKTEYKNFVSEYTKSRDFVPPPGMYNLNRSMIIKNKKMYFGKGTRVTMTDQIIKIGKKNTNGPGMYKIKFNNRIKGVCKSTDQKSLGFIDDAQFVGKNSPPYYNAKLVTANSMTSDFKRQSKERETKIEKK